MQIVLARIDDDQVVDRQGRVDLGEQHTFRKIKVPTACMWLRSGTQADIEKATSFAKANGYSVFCYDGSVRRPLEQARKDILAA